MSRYIQFCMASSYVPTLENKPLKTQWTENSSKKWGYYQIADNGLVKLKNPSLKQSAWIHTRLIEIVFGMIHYKYCYVVISFRG